jgi:hypothetical protein
MTPRAFFDRLRLSAGSLSIPCTLPDPHPCETVKPVREGFTENQGVRLTSFFRIVAAAIRDIAVVECERCHG